MNIRLLFILYWATGNALLGSTFQEGVDAYHESEYEVAAAAFEKTVEKEESGAIRHNLALSLYQQGNASEAVWQLERALLLEPTNEQYHFKLGALRQQLGLTATRPAWHQVASQALSPQIWILLAAISFWTFLATLLLPGIGGFRAPLSVKALRYLSLAALLLSATALFLNRDQSSRGIVITDIPTDLHAAPASAAPQIGLARPGERGQLVDQHINFVEIETEGGVTGWIDSTRFSLLQ